MERNIGYEIVIHLLESDSHPRRIAKDLEVPHTTVIRRLKGLYDMNMVDFREEGRNKVFFLEETLEARSVIISAEIYKFTKTLDLYPRLRPLFNSIIRDDRIHMAILFGSYARGAPTYKSDIDIFVETKDRDIKTGVEKLQSRVSVKIGDFDRSSDLLREIESNHVIIKGFEDYVGKTRVLQ
ncbi:nucleotidyltransferase domain-containing protein [Methanolacinia petrolearia]|uniref:nucleotidyltransferase domain-containing protein n=1 Tax=Methanolacinia petrolearia TaxID=54120 RepID=UPI003BAD2E40